MAADLYLGHFSLSAPPGPRFEAAAQAGFTGMSLLWSEVLEHRVRRRGLLELRGALAATGLSCPQMEIIGLPAAAALAAFAAGAQEIADTSAELGCQVVHCAGLTPGASRAELVQGFGVLAEACAQVGLACGVEFVPFLTTVPDLDAAKLLVRAAGVAGGGVVVDALHFFRCGAPWADLADLTADEVVSIQINDGPVARPTDDYYAEAMGLRLPPGQGEFDLARLLATLNGRGPMPPLTAEVINRDLLALPSAMAARRIADAARAFMTSNRENA